MTAPRPVGHGAAQVYFRPAGKGPVGEQPNPKEAIMNNALRLLPRLAVVLAYRLDGHPPRESGHSP